MYEPYIDKEYTIGNYARLVEEAYEKDLISNGKREEYLIQSYLSDLVYNLEDLWEEIFYDTDCLSCFVSIDDVTILKKLFEKVVVPYEVYEEFSRVVMLKKRVDDLHYDGFLEIRDFDVESESYDLFLNLCKGKFTGRKIGDGEAAAITLAVENNGILARIYSRH